MGEIRRHSVDVPITRTLVALRRVRSLRDPCTNSMSKFASLLDNVKWETGSNNGISLQFVNNVEDEGKLDDVGHVGLVPFGSYSIMEELENGCDLHKLSSRVLNVEGDACSRSSERSCGDLSVKSRDLACTVPSIRRTHYSTKVGSSVGEYGSRVGSPMTSTNHTYGDDDVDFADQCNRGCGITYCWSMKHGDLDLDAVPVPGTATVRVPDGHVWETSRQRLQHTGDGDHRTGTAITQRGRHGDVSGTLTV